MTETDDTIQGKDTTSHVSRPDSLREDATSAPRCILIQNKPSELASIRDFLQSLCQEFGIGDELFMMLNLAVEEWVFNVISYAYPEGTQSQIELSAMAAKNILTLKIKDQGLPFDPTQYPDVDVDAGLEERQIGGLGIHLVRNIMDTMHYERTDDGCNILTLTKEIK